MGGIKERKGQDVGVLKGWEVGKRWILMGNNPEHFVVGKPLKRGS